MHAYYLCFLLLHRYRCWGHPASLILDIVAALALFLAKANTSIITSFARKLKHGTTPIAALISLSREIARFKP